MVSERQAVREHTSLAAAQQRLFIKTFFYPSHTATPFYCEEVTENIELTLTARLCADIFTLNVKTPDEQNNRIIVKMLQEM